MQAGGPALGALQEHTNRVVIKLDLRNAANQLEGFRTGQREVNLSQLRELLANAQAMQTQGDVAATRDDEVNVARSVLDDCRDLREQIAVANRLERIEHEHEVGHALELLAERVQEVFAQGLAARCAQSLDAHSLRCHARCTADSRPATVRTVWGGCRVLGDPATRRDVASSPPTGPTTPTCRSRPVRRSA